MALDVRIISGGTTYYLVNSTGAPVAGGAATGASTTPYSVNAAEWTQTAADRQTIYSGSPPFRIGSTPLYTGFGNVTETVEIGIIGSSSDNVAALKQQLYKILNTALYTYPAALYWQPNGAANATYFDIYSANVQEVGDWQNPAAGFTSVLCRVTWVRSLGSWASAGETLLSGVTMTNTGTGTNPNIQSLGSSGKGEFVNDGQPMNLSFATATSPSRTYVAVVSERTYTTQTAATKTTTSIVPILGGTITLAINARAYQSSRLRVLMRFSSFTTNAQVRLSIGLAPASLIYWYSPWVTGMGTAYLADMGGFHLPSITNLSATPSYDINWYVRSTNGASATAALTYSEYLAYSTFATVTSLYTWSPMTSALDGYRAVSGRPAQPLDAPETYLTASGFQWGSMDIVGTAPRYYPGSYLYLGWMSYDPPQHSTTSTATVTASHTPLYNTLRGNS